MIPRYRHLMYLDRKPPWCRCYGLSDCGLYFLREEKIRHKRVAEDLCLCDVISRVDEELELQVGNLMNVQVETFEFDRPSGHFAISRKYLKEREWSKREKNKQCLHMGQSNN
jgi:hypothetical protein